MAVTLGEVDERGLEEAETQGKVCALRIINLSGATHEKYSRAMPEAWDSHDK